MPPDPLNGLGLIVQLNIDLEMSEKSQGISYCQESGNPDSLAMAQISANLMEKTLQLTVTW